MQAHSKSPINTEFINLQTDFGFKHIFGTLKHKSLLIRFLNALFKDLLTVRDVTYHDKEILPAEEKGKRIVYDVYCTSKTKRKESLLFPKNQLSSDKGNSEAEHHFILEMQNIYSPPFEERMVYYVCQMVSRQGKAGWDYTLDPVFAVAVLDFNFSHLKPKLIRRVMLSDTESGERLTDKVRIIFCSLPELPLRWEECVTEIEQMLYLIKNMESMDRKSKAYIDGNYSELFDAARSSELREEEIVYYSQSLEKLRETQRGIEYAAEEAARVAAEKAERKGIAKGRAEGIVEGRAEGRDETLRGIVRFMLEQNADIEFISKATGLSKEEIQKYQ
ncbi:MAG: Rpn family recombination-promoting nuclease/putative transposase [Muribaculaceae bacterium]|nr:Rpn family recombination-promoting nuclease/putative transposase [Muribaculaceae bacterium]